MTVQDPPPRRTSARVPVPPGLSRQHRPPAHLRGILTAYKLSKFRVNRNPARSRRPARGAPRTSPRTALTATAHHLSQRPVAPRA